MVIILCRSFFFCIVNILNWCAEGCYVCRRIWVHFLLWKTKSIHLLVEIRFSRIAKRKNTYYSFPYRYTVANNFSLELWGHWDTAHFSNLFGGNSRYRAKLQSGNDRI
jgi:hypothetical protein